MPDGLTGIKIGRSEPKLRLSLTLSWMEHFFLRIDILIKQSNHF